MTIKTVDLNTFKLASGSHASFEEGACAMELVAYMAGEEHSDSPECACPTISSYVRRLNDHFDAEERQLLKPYLPRIIGTGDDNGLRRSKILAHAALTVFAAGAMESAGLPEQAVNLKACVFGEWQKNREIAASAFAAASAAATYASAAYAAYAANAATSAASAAASAAANAYASAAANAYASASASASANASANAAYAAAYAASGKEKKPVGPSRADVIQASLKLLDEVLSVK